MQLRLFSGAIYLMIGLFLLTINLTEKAMIGLEPGPLTLMIGIMTVALGLFRLWTALTMHRKKNLAPPPIRRRVRACLYSMNPKNGALSRVSRFSSSF